MTQAQFDALFQAISAEIQRQFAVSYADHYPDSVLNDAEKRAARYLKAANKLLVDA